MSKPKRLIDPRWERFAQLRAKGQTADAAYVSAGFRANRSNAARLNANERIQDRITEILARGADRIAVTQENIVRELARIGFADSRKAAKWGPNRAVLIPANGRDKAVTGPGVVLVDSDDLDDDTAAAISEISATKDGIKVKFHDKRAALVDLGKHKGMFKDDPTKAGDIHLHFDGLMKGLL